MTDWPAWLGDLPTWITTVAIGFAAGQFFIERKRRRAEEDREAKAQASQLTAWAVTDAESKPRVYGVIVANTSNSTFHDVCIAVTMHGESTRPIDLGLLPPGDFFIEFNGPAAQYAWSFAVPTESYRGRLRPYMQSRQYRVDRVDFADNLNQRWSTNEHAVLTQR